MTMAKLIADSAILNLLLDTYKVGSIFDVEKVFNALLAERDEQKNKNEVNPSSITTPGDDEFKKEGKDA